MATVIICFLLLLAGLVLYVHLNIDRMLAKRLGRLPHVSVNYDLSRINIFKGKAVFESISLAFPSQTEFIPPAFECRLNSLEIHGFSLFGLWRSGELKLNSVVLEGGDIRLKRLEKKPNPVPSNKKFELKGLHIKDLKLKDISFQHHNGILKDFSGNVFLDLQELYLPIVNNRPILEEVLLKQISGKLQRLCYDDRSSFYRINVETLDINSEAGLLGLSLVSVVPLYDKNVFSRMKEKQINRVEVSVSAIKFSGFKLEALHQKIFAADELKILGCDLDLYRDKRVPFRNETEIPMPMEALKSLPIAIDIKRVDLVEALVKYEAFALKGKMSGKVFFEKVNVGIQSLTNRPLPNSPEYMRIDLSGLLMGKGSLKAVFTFPFNEKNKYTAKGILEEMDLTIMNEAAENLAGVRLKRGIIHSMRFNFDYDSENSQGELELQYSDVKVSRLKEKSSEASSSPIISFIMNKFIINNEARGYEDHVRKSGEIWAERDKKRPVFNYWWKSIFSGLVNAYNLEGLVEIKKAVRSK